MKRRTAQRLTPRNIDRSALLDSIIRRAEARAKSNRHEAKKLRWLIDVLRQQTARPLPPDLRPL